VFLSPFGIVFGKPFTCHRLKIVGGFFQSMPAGGSLSRTAVNVSAGARTRLANILSAVFIAIMLLVVLPLIDRLFDNSMRAFILILVGIFFLLILGTIMETLPIWRVVHAVKRADFDTAVSQLDKLPQTTIQPTGSALKGAILAAAGQYEQAEQLVRDELAQSFESITPKVQTLLLDTLGRTLTSQARYEEAIHALEGAILITPERFDTYNALAEAHLFNGTQPNVALTLAETAVSLKKRTWFWGLLIERDLYGEGYANQAWALMRLQDRNKAHQQLKRAFRWASPRSRHNLAGIHLRAGYVHLLDGDRNAAIEHFTTARQLGNRGNYGRLATKALKSL